MAKDVFTSGEVAGILGIPPRTARRYITTGKINGTQNHITGTWAVSRDNLVAFMQQHNMDADKLLGNTRILVIDDDPDLISFVVRALEKNDRDYLIESAENGLEAMIKLGSVKPDLVCLDINLPDINGWEVLQAIRDSKTLVDPKVLVISGYPEHLREMRKFRFDDSLIKPFTSGELLQKVGRMLGDSR